MVRVLRSAALRFAVHEEVEASASTGKLPTQASLKPYTLEP